MIVVVGSLSWRSAPPAAPAGRACGIALAAASRGARVELIGRVGEDAAGEALLLALSRAGVGHVAVLRDPVRPTPIVAPPPAAPADDQDPSPFAEPAAAASAPSAMAVSAGPRLEGADVDLGMRYITPSGVLVVTEDVPSDVLAVAVEAGQFADTRLVVLVAAGGLASRSVPVGLPEDATVLAAPDVDDDGAFDALVGAYAAALDGGADAASAFATAQAATGWEAAAAE
ncbi:MAG TPA: hypothetical protein VIR16_00630 [Candidatus Limnocylindrales bacterium]